MQVIQGYPVRYLFDSNILHDCHLCPRSCGVDRRSEARGFCKTNTSLYIASITRHRGEEPVLTGRHGICNVFFGHCNLRCIFCQNHQIARNEALHKEYEWSLAKVCAAIIPLLDSGIRHLGFVSPGHMAPQMLRIIQAVEGQGYHPVVVYNSNGYDRVETLRELEDWVDVYLPDYKYADARLGQELSAVSDYPDVAMAALQEMYRQKGSVLQYDENGLVQRGLIVRHLVLPGAVDNSLLSLRRLASELSLRVAVSLMSQYQPIADEALPDFLRRGLHEEEYARVCEAMEELGFEQGWTQAMASARCYNPDFTKDEPFSGRMKDEG